LKLKNKRKAEDDIIEITENDENVCLPEGVYYKLKQLIFLNLFFYLVNQKDFTNALRNQLKHNFPDHPNLTMTEYTALNSNVMIKIKSK
jgi:hypothetical protein